MENSMSVIDWFKRIKDKHKHLFISFDICEFYPSITEDLLDKAISWARQYTTFQNYMQIKIFVITFAIFNKI